MVVPGNVKIKVCGPAITVNMLSMLDPKTLHSIELKSFEHPDAPGYERWSTEKVTQLTSLDQWEQASKLTATDPFDYCEPSHFSQFEELDFTIDGIDRDSVSELRNRHWSFADNVTLHNAFPNVDGYYLAFHHYTDEDALNIIKLSRD
ncbi:hypothetical protein CRE_30198 [Caenorhabditis remanei]|uniref:DUF38 domain-containing protein n=1 Tax=Caenorhabditis remanei TaxID=31234 RepID=E3NGM9_CAERE|nr:hypothetical protein CRE_30198 [Caenorhabditis remanei]